MRGHEWSRVEVEALVADYLDMLALELRREPFSKTARRRQLAMRLDGRTEGSIERKHQNVSAILRELNHPWVNGYKPLTHYQELLAEVVVEQVFGRADLATLVEALIGQPVAAPAIADLLSLLQDPPEPAAQPSESETVAEESRAALLEPAGAARGINYFEREVRNATLGLAGERLVVAYEQERLAREGQERLAGQVEHVSRTRGDVAGFDVLSFDASGAERLIEVKTTRFAKETPFFVTQNELAVSRGEAERYHIYRLFRFGQEPAARRRGAGLYTLHGALDKICSLRPTSYRACVA